MLNEPTCDKHTFKIIGAEDHFLMGMVYFKCQYCDLGVAVDRLYFYLSLKGRTNV